MTTEIENKRTAYMKEYMQKYRKDNPDQKKRTQISFTGKEYKEFKKLADMEGKTFANLIKELALASLYERENFPEEVKQSLIETRHILRGVGNNINQIARHSNQFKEFTQEKELINELKAFEESIKKFLGEKQLRNNLN